VTPSLGIYRTRSSAAGINIESRYLGRRIKSSTKRASPWKKKVPRVDTPGLNEKIILNGSKVKIKSPRSRNSPRAKMKKDLLNVRIIRPLLGLFYVHNCNV